MKDAHRDAAIAYVDHLIRETGLDLTNLARRAGISSTTLTRFHNDPAYRNSLSGRTLKKLSDVTGVPLPTDLGGGTASPRTFIASHSTRSVLRDLPVLGTSRVPTEMYWFDVDAEPSRIERPCFLYGQFDAYAVYVNDRTMEPVFRPGEIVYVSPSVPASPGDDVAIQLTTGSGLIKRLERRTGRQIVLKQFSPKRLSAIDIASVRAMHPIVGALRTKI
jgi:transcriptional regulator with XRE-family HTH domain